MGEFLAAALQIVAVLGLDGILNGTRDGVVNTQHGTLNQLDLTGGITTQATTTFSAGGLSLTPGLGG